jgi:hypothetical protein
MMNMPKKSSTNTKPPTGKTPISTETSVPLTPIPSKTLTSSSVDSPAKTSLYPVLAPVFEKAHALVSGFSYAVSLGRYDHEASCWRTFQRSLFETETELLVTLPKWGMTQDGVLYRLRTPTPPTAVKDGSVLRFPTPLAHDATDRKLVKYQIVSNTMRRGKSDGGRGVPSAPDGSGEILVDSRRSELEKAERVGTRITGTPKSGGAYEEQLSESRLGGATSGTPDRMDVFGLMQHRYPTYQGVEQLPYEEPRVVPKKQPHWKERMKALGNIAMPTVVAPIAMELIQELDRREQPCSTSQ